MAEHVQYVPILKAKMGEFNALEKTKHAIRSKFTPLLEVPAIPSEYKGLISVPAPAKTISAHLSSVMKLLAKSWPKSQRFFIDGFYIEDADVLPDSREPMEAVLDTCRTLNMMAVPVVGLHRAPEYMTVVKAAVASDKRGFCLRLLPRDITPALGTAIGNLIRDFSVGPKSIDLVLDFGPITAESVPTILRTLAAQINSIPFLPDWRTFTLAASAFPLNLSAVGTDSVEPIVRNDWNLWLDLRKKAASVKRMPHFADYGTSHPEPVEIDPRIMNKAPNIKYTADGTWTVAKGKANRRTAKTPTTPGAKAPKPIPPDRVQYPILAGKIMARPEWKVPTYSEGDKQIADCAAKKSTGSATTWVMAAVNHHIAFVVEQLASLP